MKKVIALSMVAALSIAIAPVTYAAETTNPYGTSIVDPAGPNEVIFCGYPGRWCSNSGNNTCQPRT